MHTVYMYIYMYNVHVCSSLIFSIYMYIHNYTVTIRRRALILLYMPTFKAELINVDIPNSKTKDVFFRYWLAHQLFAVRDVHCTVLYNVCACIVQCVCGIKRG